MTEKRLKLIDHLRNGPIRADDWERYGSSRTSLRVRIWKLRERGFNITTRTDSRAKRRQGSIRPVIYELVE